MLQIEQNVCLEPITCSLLQKYAQHSKQTQINRIDGCVKYIYTKLLFCLIHFNFILK